MYTCKSVKIIVSKFSKDFEFMFVGMDVVLDLLCSHAFMQHFQILLKPLEVQYRFRC